MKTDVPITVQTIWCDDIRQELSNKLSFIGAFGTEAVFPQLPKNFLRICAYISCHFAIAEPPKILRAKLVRDDKEVIAESEPIEVAFQPSMDLHGKTRGISNFAFQVHLLSLPDECKFIQALVTADGQEIEGQKLWIYGGVSAPAHGTASAS